MEKVLVLMLAINMEVRNSCLTETLMIFLKLLVEKYSC